MHTEFPRKPNKRAASILLATLTVLLLAGAGFAQEAENIVKLKATLVSPKPVRAGQRFTVNVRAAIADGWHLYSLTQPPGGPMATQILVGEKQPFKQSGEITGPPPLRVFDPNFNIETEIHQGAVQFKVRVIVDPAASPGARKITLGVVFQTCNETQCLPPSTVTATAPVTIAAPAAPEKDDTAPAPSRGSAAGADAKPAEPLVPRADMSAAKSSRTGMAAIPQRAKEPATPSTPAEPATTALNRSLGSFLWLAAVMGLLSLLTPCVFPMIPITVSYFTNHAGGSRRSAVSTALVYGIGIILTFSALGMTLAVIFGAGGVNQLAANPWVNLLITAIFLGFAFSLFGAFLIQLPAGLLSRLQSATQGEQRGEVIGALLMGFAFTLTSFTCTAPFVGTLLVMTAQGNWRWPLMGMLAFSTTFAVPFVVLALIPQFLSQLPKAGGWMNSVKVVMGFLEIAAAMKFLSNADLVWHWGIFTRQVVLATWVGLGMLIVVYVMGYFRMSHDAPVQSLSAFRVAVAIVFLTLTIWLIPGLFGRQLGELESFLPPETGSPASFSVGSITQSAAPITEAGWIMNDYEAALTTARQHNKPLFIDFTGYTCTNCRWMESNMFPRPDVSQAMDAFVRVRLYTDGKGDVFKRQQKLQQEKFGTVALPFYVILRPDGGVVSTFPGLTRNPNDFMTFLRSAENSKPAEHDPA